MGSRSFEESLGWLSSLLFLRRAKASMQPCNFSGWLLIWSGRIVMMGKRESLRVSIFTPGLNPGWLHNMTLHCAVKTNLVSSQPNKTLHSKMLIFFWFMLFYSFLPNVIWLVFCLSSPRAESARAFTGRRNSHSGRGEDFLTGQPNFFTETAVTPERKVEKSFPRWEINRHAKG